MRANHGFRLGGLAGVIAIAIATGCAQVTAPAATAPSGTAPASGVGSPAAATAAPKPAAPNVEQRVTAAILGVGASLDPWGVVSAPTNAYQALAFESLITLDSGEPAPLLAERWQNTDPNTWVFTLKDRRYWNGDPVTSTDAKFTFELARDPRASNALGPTFVGSIDTIEAPDPRTLILRTKEPDVLIPNKVARIPVFPKALYESQGRQAFEANPVGSGPYRHKEITPQERVVLVPNETYPGPKGQLTELTVRAVPEATTRVAAIRTGEADLASQVEIDQLPQLTGTARPIFGVTPAIISFFFDTNTPEFRDRRVRLAFNQAVDRSAIVRSLADGITQPAPGQPVIEGSFGYNPNVRAYPYDEARARQLLAEAGFPNGFALKVGFPATQPFYFIAAETVVPYLQRIGVRAELGGYENAVNLAGFRNNSLGPFILSIITASTYVDPAISLSSLTAIQGQGSGRWSNPDFDRLYEAQLREFDRNRRLQTLQQMMQLIHDEAPLLPMYASWTIWASSDRVDGFEIAPTGYPQWLQVRRVK